MMEDGRPAPLCVLIVDDCPDTTASLAFLAQWWGYRVEVAAEGQAALRLAAEHHPDVVVLDIGLPGMSGWELARRLRVLPGVEGALLVAASGFGQETDHHRSHEAGCDLHLLKPFDPERLHQLLTAREKEVRPHVPREADPAAGQDGDGR